MTSTKPQYQVILVTCPDENTAVSLCRGLLNEHLIACGNIVPKIRSIYRWQGKIEDDTEVLALLKTTRENFEAVSKSVKRHHPYDTPEVISIDITNGNGHYLQWITDCLNLNEQPAETK